MLASVIILRNPSAFSSVTTGFGSYLVPSETASYPGTYKPSSGSVNETATFKICLPNFTRLVPSYRNLFAEQPSLTVLRIVRSTCLLPIPDVRNPLPFLGLWGCLSDLVLPIAQDPGLESSYREEDPQYTPIKPVHLQSL